MDGGSKVIVGLFVSVIVIGGVATFMYYNKKKNTPAGSAGGATDQQFDNFYKTSESQGYDTFKDLTVNQIKDIRDKFKKNLNSKDADELNSIAMVYPESSWTATQKKDFAAINLKWKK